MHTDVDVYCFKLLLLYCILPLELKKLVADFDLYKEFIDGLLVKHAQDHFAIVPASSDPASASFLLTPVNYLDGYYID